MSAGMFSKNRSGGVYLRRGMVCLVSMSMLTGLAGCDAEGGDPFGFAFTPNAEAKATQDPSAPVVNQLPTDTGALKKHDTEIIDSLKMRHSAVPSGSTEAKVSTAVLAADKGPEASQLRAAALRAEARDKNWLPSIDPQVSLASLGTFAASLLADMVLFDNGRKKQERAFAHADVDVTAVALAENRNKRIKDALSLQIAASEAREKSAVSDEALKQMTEYRRILNGRVTGGVDNPADLAEMDRLLAELRANSESEKRTLEASRNQLSALTNGQITDPPKPQGLALSNVNATPLPVLRSKAEFRRETAELNMARAQMLPTLSAGGTTRLEGVTGGVSTGGSVMIFGRKAEIASIEARTEAAADKVETSEADTKRELQRYTDDAASYRSGAREAKEVASELSNNHDLYYRQFQAGQRKLMDVANIYTSMINQRKLAIGQHYQALEQDAARAEKMGVLLDGDQI